MEAGWLLPTVGNWEPVPSRNRFQLTISIGIVRLWRYWSFLTILSFPCLHKEILHCCTFASHSLQRLRPSTMRQHLEEEAIYSAVCNQCNQPGCERTPVNIAASQFVAKLLFFFRDKESQVVPTSSGAVLLTLKAAHLNNWLHGLTFLRWSAVSPVDQLLA